VGKRGIALESVEAFAEQQRAGRDGLDGLVRRRDRHKGAPFATFPPDLIEPCIKAGTPVDGIVLDPFGGSGTTALVANRLERNAILLEINPDYAKMAHRRLIDSGIEENSIFLC
jgi:DNA modification methylase